MYKNDIGINSGTIWHLLAARGALVIIEIKESISYKDIFIYLVSGWLSSENKIRFFEKDEKTVRRIELDLPEYY
jgi:hypothetical protein